MSDIDEINGDDQGAARRAATRLRESPTVTPGLAAWRDGAKHTTICGPIYWNPAPTGDPQPSNMLSFVDPYTMWADAKYSTTFEQWRKKYFPAVTVYSFTTSR